LVGAGVGWAVREVVLGVVLVRAAGWLVVLGGVGLGRWARRCGYEGAQRG
jgi:hypothetical protein